ncbi:MAG: cytochrome b/b6 domain-containing protein [Rhodobiaceae bacterium]
MVWDLPTRLFHWGFAGSIIGAYITGENGATYWHELFGLAAFGLLVFRLIWGFIGHPSARFSTLLHPPAVIAAYIRAIFRRATPPFIGHNPLGGLAVIALLALMGGMAVTGLWTGDDILYEAPLSVLAPQLFADWPTPAGRWHSRLHDFILPLVALHVSAIIFHRLWLGEKLAARMVTGGIGGQMPARRRSLFGLALLALCLTGALSLSLLTPTY